MAASPLAVPLLVEPQVVESQVALGVPERGSLVEQRLAALALLLLEELQLTAQRPAGLAEEAVVRSPAHAISLRAKADERTHSLSYVS